MFGNTTYKQRSERLHDVCRKHPQDADSARRHTLMTFDWFLSKSNHIFLAWPSTPTLSLAETDPSLFYFILFTHTHTEQQGANRSYARRNTQSSHTSDIYIYILSLGTGKFITLQSVRIFEQRTFMQRSSINNLTRQILPLFICTTAETMNKMAHPYKVLSCCWVVWLIFAFCKMLMLRPKTYVLAVKETKNHTVP